MVLPRHSPELTPTEASSVLSEVASTALLNRVEQDLGLTPNVIDINLINLETVDTKPRKARTHKDLDGTHYIELTVKKDKGKIRSAWYWDHGAEYEIQNSKKEGKKPRVWVCNHCTAFHSYTVNGSQHIKDHLKRTHKIHENQTTPQPMLIAERLRQQHAPAQVDSRLLAEGDKMVIHKRKFEEALVAFLCCAHIAFNIVENEFFVALLTTSSNFLPDVLPNSHNTAKDWAMVLYQKRKLRVKELLQKARSNIHLSFNLWSSPNHYSFNAVVAHFVTFDYKIASVLIGFRNLLGVHSGENIAASVQEVVQEYEIQSRLGCFVLDNAYSNDTAVEALGKEYKWAKNEHKQRRLRCMGHIINLVAQAFLLGEKQEMFEQALAKAEKDQDKDEAIKLWQLCGPIGKLHYIVVFILRTSQRREAFKRGGNEAEATALVPKRDNSTRWNSICQMIRRACKLFAQINLFCTYTYKAYFTEEMLLRADDWHILNHLAAAMTPFESATKAMEGQANDGEFGAMGECIPIIEALSNDLSELQIRHPIDTSFEITELDDLPTLPALLNEGLPPRTGNDPASGFILECTNRAHAKLAEYYGLTDESSWFIAGMVLNPTLKWKWCTTNWSDKPNWLQQAQDNMKKLWRSTYKPTHAAQSSSSHKRAHGPDRSQLPAKSIRRDDNYRDSIIYNWNTDSEDEYEQHIVDEYDAYLQEKRLRFVKGEERSPTWLLDYWKDK